MQTCLLDEKLFEQLSFNDVGHANCLQLINALPADLLELLEAAALIGGRFTLADLSELKR